MEQNVVRIIHQRDYKVKFTIFNDTQDDFKNIIIQHRPNSNDKKKPNKILIKLLQKGKRVQIGQLAFAKNFPSKASNIFFTMIPFFGWSISALRGWGKDYWSIFCNSSKFDQQLSTDTGPERWFANIFELDIYKGAEFVINWNQQRQLYWISLNRKSNGQSTRYLDMKDTNYQFSQQ